MDQVVTTAKLIFIIHMLMATAFLIGVWIGRTSYEDKRS